jgi:hypothetical protein
MLRRLIRRVTVFHVLLKKLRSRSRLEGINLCAAQVAFKLEHKLLISSVRARRRKPTRIKQLINDWRSVLEPARLLVLEVLGTIALIDLVVRAILK